MSSDISQARDEPIIYLLCALRSKACSQQVKRICRGCSCRPCHSTTYEALRRSWHLPISFLRQLIQHLGSAAISQELDCSIAQVQSFGGYVAFPEACNAFMAPDLSCQDVDASRVCSTRAGDRERIGERVVVKLKPDLDDVERSDAEAGYQA